MTKDGINPISNGLKRIFFCVCLHSFAQVVSAGYNIMSLSSFLDWKDAFDHCTLAESK